MQRVGSSSIALTVGHSSVRFSISAAVFSSLVTALSGTSFRQSVGQTSTQPLHKIQRSPSKIGLIVQMRQRPACSWAAVSLYCSSTLATPTRRSISERRRRTARPAQIITQWANVGIFTFRQRCEEAFAHQARLDLLQIAVNATRRSLAVRYGIDNQARAKSDVAAGEDPGRGRHQGLFVDHQKSRAAKLRCRRRAAPIPARLSAQSR